MSLSDIVMIVLTVIALLGLTCFIVGLAGYVLGEMDKLK